MLMETQVGCAGARDVSHVTRLQMYRVGAYEGVFEDDRRIAYMLLVVKMEWR